MMGAQYPSASGAFATEHQAALSYWRPRLEQVRQPTAFGQRRLSHGDALQLQQPLTQELLTALLQYSERQSCSLSGLLTAAWGWLLYRYSGSTEVCFGLLEREDAAGLVPLLGDFQAREVSVNAWLRQQELQLQQARRHRGLTLAELHGISGVTAGEPLFSSLLILDDETAVKQRGFSVSLTLTFSMTTPARLLLHAAAGHLSERDLQRIARDLTQLLLGLSQARWRRVTQIALSTPSAPIKSREQRTCRLPQQLMKALQEAARRNRVAIYWRGCELSYAQLLLRIAQIQRRLEQQGIQPGQRVGLHLMRQPDGIAALLACLFSDLTFVALEPDFPADRLQAIQQEAQLAAVLQDWTTARQLEFDCQRIVLDPADDAAATVTLGEGAADTAAYMMFTSGSTGKPKGVVIDQRALGTFLQASVARLALTERAHWLLITTPAFDISLLELLAPLWVGAALHLTDSDEYRDPQAVLRYLQQPQINLLQATPTFWRMLYKAGWQGKADLVALCGGEALDVGLAQRLSSDTAALWNCYGPTEATVWSQMARIEAQALDGCAFVPLGDALDGYRHLVLDEELNPLGEGMVGELCIMGDALSSGYWLRPELTADRFVRQPESGQRLYRTGDRVRLLAGDRYQYLGRFDDQIKLRGFRIELGEIEAQLKRIAQVQDAAVKLQGQGDEACLVGYVELKVQAQLTRLEIRRRLQRFLPGYMVPGRILLLERLPKTGSGKVDRQRLPPVER